MGVPMSNPVVIILKACAFAAHKHRNQRRKDQARTPYINHPLTVARVLAEEGGVIDAEVLAAAILHDTLEDTDTTLKELQNAFGKRIAAMVAEVTDDKTIPKPVRKQRQIDHASHKSQGAALIKAADKICNLRDLKKSPPTRWTLERRREYIEWAQQVVCALPIPLHRIRRVFAREYASNNVPNFSTSGSVSLKRRVSRRRRGISNG